MWWTTFDHDIDLYIIDPVGNEFHYRNHRVPGRPGELSVDATKGPGVEIWGATAALPGEYQVLYTFYHPYGNEKQHARVEGVVYFRDGHQKLGKRVLKLTDLKRPNATLAAIVTVNDDGSVEVFEP